MELKEFIADRKQVLDDFEHHWEHLVKTGKARTKFHPEQRWKEEFALFMERYADGEPQAEEQDNGPSGRRNESRNRQAA